jgi:hypothetical protein
VSAPHLVGFCHHGPLAHNEWQKIKRFLYISGSSSTSYSLLSQA